MSDRCRSMILQRLLDKYERTAAYHSGAKPGKRILLNLYGGNKTDFPAYDIEDHATRNDINGTVIELKRCGFVDYEWCRGEEGHILRRLWLNVDRTEDIYRELHRIPAREHAKAVLGELEDELDAVSSEWMIAFYSDVSNYVQEKLKLSSLLPSDTKERRRFYQMLRLIDKGTSGSVSERVFSERCFGDSKYFESHLKSVLLTVMRRYVDGNLTDAELLRGIGISRYPESLELRGNIVINGSTMAVLKNGFCIYSDEINSIMLEIPAEVIKIMTIENRANFFAYKAQDDELVVYHGGQYSPAKKRLFEKIVCAMPEGCKWHHWGDIDFGGFSMLLRLRKEILRSVQPYRMDKNELERFTKYTLPFQQSYADKLDHLREQELLSDCRECLEYMLEHRVKLEQEAMLT